MYAAVIFNNNQITNNDNTYCILYILFSFIFLYLYYKIYPQIFIH
jgi:hypothetical protein